MANKGNALYGYWYLVVEKNVLLKQHVRQFTPPLLETTIDGAEDVIVNVTGGLDLTLIEAEEASQIGEPSSRTRSKHLARYFN